MKSKPWTFMLVKFCRSAVVRQNFTSINVQGLLFIAAHQINVELGDADLAQNFELLAMFLDGADQTKTVNDFVGDEISVVTADLAMVMVVILAAIADEGRQALGKLFGLVL